MKKKVLIIVSIFVVLLGYISYIYFNSKKDNLNSLSSGIAMYVYNTTTNSFVANASIPVGNIYILNTTLSHCVSGSTISEYNASAGTINYALNGADWCYIYFDVKINYANDYFIELAQTDTTNLAEDDYDNVRYIGANPDNYACFDDGEGGCINYDKDDATNKPAGLFRIIGVFNSDTHGVSGEQLVKLISADRLGITAWDYKQSEVGSSENTRGSNDWSDSQLMYMLNGFVNTGYNGTTQLHTEYSYNLSGDFEISDGTTNIYILDNGNSYLTGNGATTLNIPRSTPTSGYTASTNTNMQTLTNTQANMIATVTWHLGGTVSCDSSSNGLASHWYNYERGIETCYSTEGCDNEKPTTWIGKIGLMYPSDYGYATSGGSTCANKELYNWNDTGYETCYTSDWLLYIEARTGTQGKRGSRWTISPYSSGRYMFCVAADGNVRYNSPHTTFAVLPAFYLESGVYVAGGSGTSTDPYRFAID